MNRPVDVNLFQEFKHGGVLSVTRRPGFSLARIRNRIQFNMLDLYREIFSSGIQPRHKISSYAPSMKIGLPATLTMLEYFSLWELFFKQLGFTTVGSPQKTILITAGKEITGADYCVPIIDLHGHIRHLAQRTDYVFLPQLFENSVDSEEKMYCYYCQYSVPVIQNILDLAIAKKMIAPVLNLNENVDEIIRSVYLHLPDVVKRKIPFTRVEVAFFLAWDWFLERKADLKNLFLNQLGASNDISVAFLGRPYMILHKTLNKGIPGKLAEMGIQSFYMDMIPIDDEKLHAARDFIKLNHWYYGNRIIKTAETVAQIDGLFPIYITAFKCAPDSFIIEYFKNIMDYYQKPYLILQLDEHAAAEGYDTRLEAAVETFRHFRGADKRPNTPGINIKKSFEDKTYLLPGYDLLNTRLIQGVFARAGIKSLIIEQSSDTINQSLRINDGQCLPVSVLTQGIIHTIHKCGLNPEKVVFFCNSEAELSCNLPQYPVMIKQSLEKMGQGMENIDILVTGFLPMAIPLEIALGISMAYVVSGLVQKIVHKIRPREKTTGSTDQCYGTALNILYECFATGASKEKELKVVVNEFLKIDKRIGRLPQVGIVGDLYVRDNDTFNQNLINHIEKNGAEAVTIPFIDTLKLLAQIHFQTQWQYGRYVNLLKDKVAYNMLNAFTRKLNVIAKPLIDNRFGGLEHEPLDYLKKYFFTIRHGGETTENLLKVYFLKENYPDLKLIINVYPIYCCPGLVSDAIYKKVEKEIGIPIVSITYDGTQADKNKVLNPYLYFLKL